jgi:hypothetical protein
MSEAPKEQAEWCYEGTSLTFDQNILEEVTVALLDEEYTIPAAKHPHIDPATSIAAMVVKLHQRVQVLEAHLKGDSDEHDK